MDPYDRADERYLQSTLDHSIWFYAYVTSLASFSRSMLRALSLSDEFDCGDWLLFEVHT